MPDTRPALRHVPRGVWVLGLVSLLMDVSSEMIHSLLPVYLATSLGVSVLAIGLLEGAAESTALMVKVFSGVLSDHWGQRKWLAAAGYGLGAASKPLFALSQSLGPVLAGRLLDRVGKGIRGAPRDALVADLTPAALRGAAYGLRQALDTVGAFAGPLLAIGLMLLWNNNFRAVFWVAVVPAVLSVAVLVMGVREPPRSRPQYASTFNWGTLKQLGGAYAGVMCLGAVFTLARFSEAFLVLRLQQGGLALAWTPLVLIAMNMVYAVGAYPWGKLSDRKSHTTLLAWALVVLVSADVLLALTDHGIWAWLGIALWGLHMAMSQGLLATMVAATAPPALRGTAFGFFNLVCGVATLLSSALAGLLWQSFGAGPAFAVGGLCAALAGMLLWITRQSGDQTTART